MLQSNFIANTTRVHEVFVLTTALSSAYSAQTGKNPVNTVTFKRPPLAPTGNNYGMVAGDLVVIKPNNYIDDAFVAGEPFFSIAGFDLNLGVKISKPIYKDRIEHFVVKPYVAPTNEVITVSSFPTPIIGNPYTLGIRWNDNSIAPETRKNPFVTSVLAATAVTNDLIDQFVVAINADKRGLYTAARSGATLVLTSNYNPLKSTVWFGDGLRNTSTVATQTTSITFGSGTYKEIYDLEVQSIGQSGGHHNRVYLPDSPNIHAQTNINYGMLTLWHREPNVGLGNSASNNSEPIAVTLCVPTANLAALRTLIETVSGKKAFDYTALYGDTGSPNTSVAP